MQSSEVRRAVAAAMSSVAALDLSVEDATVLNDSNRVVVRLMPCDVVARVAPRGYTTYSGDHEIALQGSQLEVEIARRLGETDSPVATLEPRVEPRVYERDGFEITLWTYYEPLASGELSPVEYSRALDRLHAGLRRVDVPTMHFLDRVADAERDIGSRDITPDLPDTDREVLVGTLRGLRRSVVDGGAAEQLLHGEPHPANVLCTKSGPLFVDFENCLRGPVEFDLAWLPAGVSERYPNADQELVSHCRGLMLAIVAGCHWRWDDQHPGNTRRAEWSRAVRQGPPWPTVEAV